jgi:signal transduction histidine kinase
MFTFTHDLRSHLRTVLTRIQLVQRGKGAILPEQDQQMLREAAKAVGDISGLLDSMLAYCSVHPDDKRMKFALVLQGTLLERKAVLQQAGAEVNVPSQLEGFVPTTLQNVLKELLTNSCKFRDKQRPLRIQIATRPAPDGMAEISVADNGIGVDKSELEKIFVPFQRLHSRDDYEGHGLGLATCRRIVTAWGGTIVAEASSPGELTVRFTVPTHADA